MIEAMAVPRFIRALVAADELLSISIDGGVSVSGEDDLDEDGDCVKGHSGLPRTVALSLMSGQDENSLGLDRVTTDQMWSVKVYGRSGERFSDIKPLAHRLDALLQGARNLDTDPRFTVARTSVLMDREQDGPNQYPYLGGIYRFLMTPESPRTP